MPPSCGRRSSDGIAICIYFNEHNNIITCIDVVYLEKDAREDELSFLNCLEWVIMAITSVGIQHGGPETELGKWVGGFCVIAGIVLFALPIPIVVASFSNAYQQMLCHEEIIEK